MAHQLCIVQQCLPLVNTPSFYIALANLHTLSHTVRSATKIPLFNIGAIILLSELTTLDPAEQYV